MKTCPECGQQLKPQSYVEFGGENGPMRVTYDFCWCGYRTEEVRKSAKVDLKAPKARR